ncbi:Ig-like domain-containing protein [Kitasatospora sp. NPDC002040]|uniref:Ig-like domain-containing protein n=1 Tax=Kitasatospora sp. NPDC002040 TaxID=3154661 RepID=UPI0033336B61
MPRSAGRPLRTATVSALTALTLLSVAGPASAADSVYGEWSVPGGSGTLTVPATGFPAATVTTDSTGPSVPSGSSAYLNGSTPFGAAYGSSQGDPYLSLHTAAGGVPSTTTIGFATPPAAGSWAFTLGDVDADAVQISGTAADGSALTAADLGHQGTFNYCTGSPVPSSCGGAQTDRPQWNAATATLTGNGPDTSGAAAWFRPVKAVKSLTFVFSVQTGVPVYQIWVAARTTSVSGSVATTGCAGPDRATVELLDVNGRPVLGADGGPVTTGTAAEGGYRFDRLTPGDYQVTVDPPEGYGAPPPVRTAAAGTDATGVDLALTCRPVKLPVRSPVRTGDGQPVVIRLPEALCDGRHLDITRKPEHGTVQIMDNCRVKYTPEADYTGPDGFGYTGNTAAGLPVSGEEAVTVVARPQLAESGRPTGPLLTAAALALALGGAALHGSRRLRRRD